MSYITSIKKEMPKSPTMNMKTPHNPLGSKCQQVSFRNDEALVQCHDKHMSVPYPFQQQKNNNTDKSFKY